MTSIRDTATRVSWIAISRTNLPTFLPSRFFLFRLDDLSRFDFDLSLASIRLLLRFSFVNPHDFFPSKNELFHLHSNHIIQRATRSHTTIRRSQWILGKSTWFRLARFFFLFFFFFFKAYLITLSILCWLIIHRVRKYQEISSQKVKLDGFDQKLGSLSKDVIIGE